jgi:EAL domain-containing protein (putative c-di-GMP-specific phosphodiesterase class I)
MRILLIDDDDGIRAAYAELLRDMGFEVETRSRAEDGLALLSGGRYDAVLSDIQMPGMSGVEFLRAIREVDLDVPVILMTGAPNVESAIEAVEHGAFRYLRKPVSAAILEETLRRAERYRALASLKREAIELTGGAARWPSDRAALEGRFEATLDRLWMAYQPIVSIRDRRVHAYEALLRSDEPSFRGPGDMIEAAEELGRLPDLGRAVRRTVADGADKIAPGVLIFVNLHPADLNDAELCDAASPLSRLSSRVVLEVTERSSLLGVTALENTLTGLRGLGFQLAVDDLGAGYAGLTSMAQLEPEYVKLDMSLIRGVHTNATQQKLVRSMASLCQDLGKQVIAEGVEEPAEHQMLVELGCDLLQGYLFGRPSREPVGVHWP